MDNLHGQSVIFPFSIDEEQSETVNVTFTISDPTNDSLNLKLFYSIDGMRDWTVFDTISNIDPNSYSQVYDWNTKNYLNGIDNTVQLRAVPSDGWEDGLSDTLSFHLDNNDPPQIVFDPVGSELSGEINFLYDIIDPEGDIPIFEFSYFNSNDGTWNVTDNATVISDSIIEWNSTLDLNDIDLSNIQHIQVI